MSYQASAWAAEQKTGSPQSKLVLLLLANRANEDGVCWPSQLNLGDQSEQSADTVQRHLKKLETGGFIRRIRGRRTRGRWPGFIYQLLMPGVALDHEPRKRSFQKRANPDPADLSSGDDLSPDTDQSTGPQGAAWTEPLPAASPSRSLRLHQAAGSGVESSYEKSHQTSPSESSGLTRASVAAARNKGLCKGRKQDGEDLVQNQIARRLGDDGWQVLMAMSAEQVAQLVSLQRRGHLSDSDIANIRREAKVSLADAITNLQTSVVTPELVAHLRAKGVQ